MLISHSHRFLFIHVNRAGGGSVIQALGPYEHVAPQGRVNRYLSKTGLVRDPERIRFRAHETARGVRRLLPRAMFDEYFKFAVVRNPWAWLVSMYFRFGTTESHRHHRVVSKLSFPEYVDWEIGRDKRHQHLFVCDDDGSLLVDFVGRLENLSADLASVCERLGIEHEPLGRVGARKHEDYRSYYDDALREKVCAHWRRDVELFGYDFEPR